MSRHRRDEHGIVGVVLTIVILFALIAVVQLTRTVVAAQQINHRVMSITGSLVSADKHLNTGCDTSTPGGCSATALPALETTKMVTSQINDAAKNLSGEAGQIVTAAGNINNDLAGQGGVQSNAAAINGSVNSIGGAVGTINSSVHSIGGTFNSLNPVVSSIATGVADINKRADVVINAANGIKGDTTVIVATVGPGGGNTIFGQACDITGDVHGTIAGILLNPRRAC